MNQKMENQLRFALQTPENIRQQTEDLNVGYDAESEKWQVIVKYHGNLEKAREIGLVAEGKQSHCKR